MSTDSTTPLKRCTKCKEEKPATVEYYTVDKRYSSGFYPSCKKCRAKRDREYHKSHPEKMAIKDKNYREKNRDKKREHDRKSKARRSPERKEAQRKYWREWNKKNPLKAKVKSEKARIKRKQAIGSHTDKDIELQYKSQRGKCWWCGKPVGKDYHIDHRIPLSRGGTNWPENLVISCPTCNLSKHNKMPHEWNGRLL